MRVCVYGAGAVGSNLAAHLHRAGHDTTVIARGAHLAAIQKQGLRVQGGAEAIHADLRAVDGATAAGKQDIVFVTVKSHGLRAIAGSLESLLTASTRVVFVQNGIPWWYPLDGASDVPAVDSFTLASTFGAVMDLNLVHGGVVRSGNEVTTPGVVLNTSPYNDLRLAPVAGGDDVGAQEIRDLITGTGWRSPVPGNIRTEVWRKLLRNITSSPMSVLLGESIVHARDNPHFVRAVSAALDEVSDIAAAYGHRLEIDAAAFLAQTRDLVPSLLQDFRLGRTMEIDALLEVPLSFARHADVRTPTLDLLVGCVSQLARHRGLYA